MDAGDRRARDAKVDGKFETGRVRDRRPVVWAARSYRSPC